MGQAGLLQAGWAFHGESGLKRGHLSLGGCGHSGAWASVQVLTLALRRLRKVTFNRPCLLSGTPLLVIYIRQGTILCSQQANLLKALSVCLDARGIARMLASGYTPGE